MKTRHHSSLLYLKKMLFILMGTLNLFLKYSYEDWTIFIAISVPDIEEALCMFYISEAQKTDSRWKWYTFLMCWYMIAHRVVVRRNMCKYYKICRVINSLTNKNNTHICLIPHLPMLAYTNASMLFRTKIIYFSKICQHIYSYKKDRMRCVHNDRH